MLVWATWDRIPILSPELCEAVYACIKAECDTLKVEGLAIGGVEDHVHLLARFPTTLDIATLVKQVKGASSHFVTHKLGRKEIFRWQGGYGAFTFSKADAPHLYDYIVHQEQHHRDKTFDPKYEFD